jgi:uncharacterized protein (TIGR00297 family)
MLENSWLIGAILNGVLLAIAAIIPKKLLTPWGLVHGYALGVIIWATLGWQGYAIVMVYFAVGSGVTKIKAAQKEAEGIAEARGGARGPENVWGSALVGTICALGFVFFPAMKTLWYLGYTASFATKLADTTASEIGKAYGKTTFLITTFKPVPRGTEGAVSLEGTLAGIGGSMVIAFLAYGVNLIDPLGIVITIVAAFIATNVESLIGATLQEKFAILTNEVVNIINTAIGAGVAIAFSLLR